MGSDYTLEEIPLEIFTRMGRKLFLFFRTTEIILCSIIAAGMILLAIDRKIRKKWPSSNAYGSSYKQFRRWICCAGNSFTDHARLIRFLTENYGPDAENLLPGDAENNGGNNGGNSGGATGSIPMPGGFWNVDLDDDNPQPADNQGDRGKLFNSNNYFNYLLAESKTSKWGNFKRKWFNIKTHNVAHNVTLFMEFSPILSNFMLEVIPELSSTGMVFDGRRWTLDELALLLDMLPVDQRDPFRLRHPDDPYFHDRFKRDSRIYNLICPSPSYNRNDVFYLDNENSVVSALKLAVKRLGCMFLTEQLKDEIFDLREAEQAIILRELTRVQATNPILARLYYYEKAELLARMKGHRSILQSPTSPTEKKAKKASPIPAPARTSSPIPKKPKPTSPLIQPRSSSTEYPTSQESATEAEMAYRVRIIFGGNKLINIFSVLLQNRLKRSSKLSQSLQLRHG
jgi:hypothetical protein